MAKRYLVRRGVDRARRLTVRGSVPSRGSACQGGRTTVPASAPGRTARRTGPMPPDGLGKRREDRLGDVRVLGRDHERRSSFGTGRSTRLSGGLKTKMGLSAERVLQTLALRRPRSMPAINGMIRAKFSAMNSASAPGVRMMRDAAGRFSEIDRGAGVLDRRRGRTHPAPHRSPGPRPPGHRRGTGTPRRGTIADCGSAVRRAPRGSSPAGPDTRSSPSARSRPGSGGPSSRCRSARRAMAHAGDAVGRRRSRGRGLGSGRRGCPGRGAGAGAGDDDAAPPSETAGAALHAARMMISVAPIEIAAVDRMSTSPAGNVRRARIGVKALRSLGRRGRRST